MEGLDARAVLEDEPELRSTEDLRRATHEWWRFTTTSVLQLWLTAQERERRLTLLALSDFANTPGERPPKDGQPPADEGARTHARTAGEPTAEGRTARHDVAGVAGDEQHRVAHDATRSGADARGTRTCNFERQQSGPASEANGQVCIAGI